MKEFPEKNPFKMTMNSNHKPNFIFSACLLTTVLSIMCDFLQVNM